MKPIIPQGYTPLLDLHDTHWAIGKVKDTMIEYLSQRLNMTRVSAPLIVDASSTVNDQYDVEKPLTFEIPSIHVSAEVVQFLDRWTRLSLYRYDYPVGRGLYTDMNAIHRYQIPNNIHSIYADHWAWAVHIRPTDRNLDYLYAAVSNTVMAICDTEVTIRNIYPQLDQLPELEREITYTTAQDLEEMYPDLTPEERENAFCRLHHTAFVRNVGTPLKNGQPHSRRRPDTGDWPLCGRLLFWDSVLDLALPIASMGIDVNAESLDHQLAVLGGPEHNNAYHEAIRNGTLPDDFSGSLGQSRLAMLLLGKAHIGEVQLGVWDQETKDDCKAAGIPLL